MASARCPRDGELLRDENVFGNGESAQVCPRCVGVLAPWSQVQALFQARQLGLADLQALIATSEKSLKTRAPTACPACSDSPLKPFRAKGIELDLCEKCGSVWFDREELSRLSKQQYGADLETDAQVLAGERSEVDGVYEMLWDCGFCDAKKLLGATNRHCPNCGAAQDATRRYFPAEGEAVEANFQFDGADTVCSACSTPNGAKAKNCRQCGAPLDGALAVARVTDETTRPRMPNVAAPKKRGPLLWILGLLSVSTCGFCGFLQFWTKDVTVTVSGHSWERSIDVQSLRTVSESAWCDSMPVGAFSVSRHREQRDTRRVADGEVCHTRNVDRGNGTFEQRRECEPKYREEPVYDERCSFSVDRWVTVRSPTERGERLTDTPRWPSVSVREGNCRSCERVGAKRETYSVAIRGPDGTKWDCEVSESKWRSLDEGAQRSVKVGVLTGGAKCDSL